ncbi:hypothetical protein [Acetobacter sp.]|uniref:hypothetical protein n=1 Tax=Acetobacter sp. TaxID=440 RepID=UPI0039E94D48
MLTFFIFASLFSLILAFPYPIPLGAFSLMIFWSIWPFIYLRFRPIAAYITGVVISLCIAMITSYFLFQTTDISTLYNMKNHSFWCNLKTMYGFTVSNLRVTPLSVVLALISLSVGLIERCIYDNLGLDPAKARTPPIILRNFFLSYQHYHGEPLQYVAGTPNAFAIVELNEQGIVFERKYIDEPIKWLKKNPRGIIVTFNHGWRQNAQKIKRESNNLGKFHDIFKNIVQEEKIRNPQNPRPVLCVFFAWQGLTYPGFLSLLTFWGRSHRVGIVAQGNLRELHAHLAAYKNEEIKKWHERNTIEQSINIDDTLSKDRPVLIHIGHSFGAFMLFTCQAQALMEAAVDERCSLSTADMIILLNPAFSANQYLPIHQAIKYRDEDISNHRTVFLSITSSKDLATKIAFRIGKGWNIFTEGFSDADQRQGLNTTIGHSKLLLTHNMLLKKDKSGTSNVILDIIPGFRETPFINAKCGGDIINGHSDIFGENLSRFIFEKIKKIMNHT